MFSGLQKKWNVGLGRLVLILCTFAIGGSACGYIARIFMPLLGIENKALWTIIYLLVVTAIWPVMVILVSIPFGQFRFFTGYLSRMGRRMFGRKKKNDDSLPVGFEQIEAVNTSQKQVKEEA